MSISKRVASLIAVAGLIGTFSGLGGIIYHAFKIEEIHDDSPPYVRLEEIAEERTQLGKDFDQCVDVAENQLAFNDCYAFREEYIALGQEEERIKNSSEYKGLEEEMDCHQGYGIGWLAFAVLSSGVGGAGVAARGRRRREESYDNLLRRHKKS